MLLAEMDQLVGKINELVRVWKRVADRRGFGRGKQMSVSRLVLTYYGGRLAMSALSRFVFLQTQPFHLWQRLPASTVVTSLGSGQGSKGCVQGCASRIVEGLEHMHAFRPLLYADDKELERNRSDILPRSGY
jgi:hypothetical protein